MKTMLKRFGQWLVMVSLALAGCARPVITQPPPTETIEPSPVPSATPTVEPTATMTQVIATKTPMPEPSPTGIVTPTLTIRKPSGEQVATYLKWLYPNWQTYGPYGPGVDTIETSFEDVNGDGSFDIVGLNPPEVYVFLWSGKEYSVPIKFSGDFPDRGYPFAELSFADWTNDGVSEIVFDNAVLSGGTGYGVIDTTRYIITCRFKECNVVWQGRLSLSINDANTGGLGEYKADIQLTSEEDGKAALHYLFSGFAIYTEPLEPITPDDDPWYSGLYVHTTTLSVYSWTGANFALTDESIVSAGYVVHSQAFLEALGPSNTKASVSIVTSYRIPDVLSENDVCQLNVQDQPVGSPFGCKQDFIRVYWDDITGDGKVEVRVVALSGAIDQNVEYVSDKKCVHQRLLAYQWNGTTATEIANITGCVVHEDLYGVRLEDYDQDGQPEILAASNSEHTHDQIYKWNGSRFVFWDDVPSH